jgi:formylglycine-generating enzyme required for sulfatase activity
MRLVSRPWRGRPQAAGSGRNREIAKLTAGFGLDNRREFRSDWVFSGPGICATISLGTLSLLPLSPMFTLRHPIDPPIRLPSGEILPLVVIPPVAEQEAAMKGGCGLTFLMGSRGYDTAEEPRHRVVIPAPFYLGVTPLTQAQFGEWTGSGAYREWRGSDAAGEVETHRNYFEKEGEERKDYPAEDMTWDEARGYCEWLNAVCGSAIPEGYRFCLPNEAQWEYACRAGTQTEYWNGDGEAALAEVGWYEENSDSRTQRVRSRGGANPWGLHDMHGNVWEWCEDVWDARAYAKRRHDWEARAWTTNYAGMGADKEPQRVGRGGSWFYSAWFCRSAVRSWWDPRHRFGLRGFRLCLSPVPVVGEGEAEPWDEGKAGAEAGEGAGRERGTSERKADAPAGAEDPLAALRFPGRRAAAP